jgi:hypothetical protein
MNIINEDILINGQTCLIHEKEHLFIIIENDIKQIEKNHIYLFNSERLIEYICKYDYTLETFYNSLLQNGYKRYIGEYPIWFPSKYKSIYKLQNLFSKHVVFEDLKG